MKPEEAAEQQRKNESLARIEFSVKVLHPKDEYPYADVAWGSTITAPVGATKEHVESVAGAWIKTMEAGLELARVRSEQEGRDG